MLTTPASLPAASPQPSAPVLEQVIGEIAAATAVAIARALCEFQRNGLSARETRMHAGAQVAQLFERWQVCAGRIDICIAARTHGTRVLRERYGRDINARTIAVLIDAVIKVLQHAIRMELN
jgi:hypothetical protein